MSDKPYYLARISVQPFIVGTEDQSFFGVRLEESKEVLDSIRDLEHKIKLLRDWQTAKYTAIRRRGAAQPEFPKELLVNAKKVPKKKASPKKGAAERVRAEAS